eukprot:CAMPEP_0206222868 /NCGR_PEP_ID=MMETSP0047_2-20121206/6188_1 /ASSEMBLY_ACC=CAM_ASM_000192 /TAXON_ID=195065 /ORGANISM="Chroomonas mesostigmatica_cf, Strain CCMP1168" /LENGTH=78 /DNA_ID=CAMNT_0053645719 /DNA_START=1 /DNA_END=237 /DNA_ORIENTATION=+
MFGLIRQTMTLLMPEPGWELGMGVYPVDLDSDTTSTQEANWIGNPRAYGFKPDGCVNGFVFHDAGTDGKDSPVPVCVQ